jgi:hypothetical protein
MKGFTDALEHISKEIKKYRELKTLDGEKLTTILQQITGTLFYLEKERANYHAKWQTVVHTLVLEGKSVSRAENEAHVQVPEMYMLRRIMDSAYEVIGAIRSNISWLKNERNISNYGG